MLRAGLEALSQGELTGRFQDPARNQGQRQFPHPVPSAVEQFVDFEGAHHAEHCGNMAMSEGGDHFGFGAGG